MSFRFRRKETTASGFRRIIREQTAAGISLLADRGNDLGDRVHEARRNLKRMRAILLLAAQGFTAEEVAKHDEALANVGRRLAGPRDADVCLSTFEALTAKLPFAGHTEIHEHFRELARIARRSISAAHLGKIATSLRSIGTAIARPELDCDGWELVVDGFDQSYRTARKSRRLARKNASDAELHAWRKILKRLFFQLELVQSILPKPLRKKMKRLERLAATLGEHHDLHVFEASIRDYDLRAKETADVKCVQALIDGRRKELTKCIRKLADSAFGEKPKAFLGAIHRAWKAKGIGCD